ncbi:RagB/SusD family nutrient uptake outer membrane protein [Hymenobacter guriensis]|uniref:RagB/SusD family nutrient uptake outer membrane protein n=1 Tax=Hymenobacter guriensis TaxID=2793065 RepID=A0ABS0L6E6_9BACT|nr:RagB/SusD family nutrient uptake outer membrane protein [Hymenobacter guriensis]MBG8555651.1 RagB/SusD family nutrient uptake outer membrane protein [Hymenobacter guriensis]
MNKHLRRGAATLAVAAALLSGGLSSCTKDLDRYPFYDLNTESVYRDPANYIQVLAKLYAGFNLSGQGTTGSPDVFEGDGLDEGETSYLRAYWYLQELVTDEAVVAWNSGPLQELNKTTWTSSNDLMRNSYTRIFYEITACNEFIRETTDEKLSDRNIAGQDAVNARLFRAEARFLRALAYYHALDLYGNVPLVTEAGVPGNELPKQATRAEVFSYIESELKAIEPLLNKPQQGPYGRADQGAAWALLAKLYLNAQVYTGTARYTDCLTYCNKVLGGGYSLTPEYAHIFMADNGVKARSEIIFPITSDGLASQTYGGTTYLIHAAIGGRMLGSAFGVSSGWAGNRTRKNLPLLFPENAEGFDSRAMFFTIGQNLEINDLTVFTDGYGVTKWSNKKSTGENGTDPTLTFVDTDFPVLRLADVYLMYAEAVLRGGQGGTQAQALTYINDLRDRAFGNKFSGGTAGRITLAELTAPNFILDERGRELYWEGTRRTDLIRFGRFTSGSYLWPWKGGLKEGKGVSDNLNLYPIPSTDIVANPTLRQNPGY